MEKGPVWQCWTVSIAVRAIELAPSLLLIFGGLMKGIRFNGQEIFDEPLIELFRCIEDARGLTTLSYFEYSVVAALLHFVRNKAELALLEVGLGGRLDAVNTVDADASLVVSVELDHQDWLGKDRESIGREKAGIFRSGRPAVVADRNPPESLLIHAQQLGSSLRLIGRDFDSSGTRGTWNYKGWGLSKENLPIPSFGGQEQLDNMAGCLAIIESMDECLPVELPVIPRGPICSPTCRPHGPPCSGRCGVDF